MYNRFGRNFGNCSFYINNILSRNIRISNKEIFFNICKLIEVDFFGKEDNSFEKDYFEDYEITDVKDYIKIRNNEKQDTELLQKYYLPKTIDISLLIDIIVWYNHFSERK